MIDVRRESRIANLAYGFLRGRSYRALEAKCYEEPNWQRVAELVRKYGQPGLPVDAIRNALKDWIALDAKMEQGALTALLLIPRRRLNRLVFALIAPALGPLAFLQAAHFPFMERPSFAAPFYGPTSPGRVPHHVKTCQLGIYSRLTRSAPRRFL
jgi:hypothetical protein